MPMADVSRKRGPWVVVVCNRRHGNGNTVVIVRFGYALGTLIRHHVHKILIISLYTSKFLHHTFVCEVEETKMMQWFLSEILKRNCPCAEAEFQIENQFGGQSHKAANRAHLPEFESRHVTIRDDS